MFRTISTILVAAVCLASLAKAASDGDDIRRLLNGSFDRPNARLTVDPVVVSGDHAIAGWSQGDMGGRALLRKKDGAWSLILCSGDGIKTSVALRHAGVPDADVLARKLAEAEAKLPASRLALFSKFEGTMMMNADGSHPPTRHGDGTAAEGRVPPRFGRRSGWPGAARHGGGCISGRGRGPGRFRSRQTSLRKDGLL